MVRFPVVPGCSEVRWPQLSPVGHSEWLSAKAAGGRGPTVDEAELTHART